MKHHFTIGQLPKWLFSTIFAVHWIGLGLRYKSLALPSVMNPQIPTGGLVGESKLVYLEQISPNFAPWIATAFRVPPQQDPESIRAIAGIDYPLIAKPDVGWCGFGVQRLNNGAELKAYRDAFPKNASFILQHFINEPWEVGIFYVRFPEAASGRLLSLTRRHIPHVVGDGRATLCSLIALHTDPQIKNADYSHLSKKELGSVPALDQYVQIRTVGSIRLGGRYEDITNLITPALTDIVDKICQSMGDFHWGRLDVRCQSEEDLRRGKFSIIEINGAGSEAIQFWDKAYTIKQSFRGVFAKQLLLFTLAHRMRKLGYKPVSLLVLCKAYFRQQCLIAHYPPSN